MKILVTNDDGIFAEGLWQLATELTKIAQVAVVAPDRERSAIGTAVTLRQPLTVQKIDPILPGVEAYAVDGTPSDSVILALGKLFANEINLVISGINHGLNLGDDVFISGTVGAALQGYVHGLPAFAISVETLDEPYLESAAKLATLLAKKIDSHALPNDIFLNVNLPNLPTEAINGARVTRLANQSHGNTVTVKEGHDGSRSQYWLLRRRLSKDTDSKTDIEAIEQDNISITPLHTTLFNQPAPIVTDNLCSELLQELREYQMGEKVPKNCESNSDS
ncbi:5'/3'-nucleotidase SurE [Chloroflexota bacterium]